MQAVYTDRFGALRGVVEPVSGRSRRRTTRCAATVRNTDLTLSPPPATWRKPLLRSFRAMCAPRNQSGRRMSAIPATRTILNFTRRRKEAACATGASPKNKADTNAKRLYEPSAAEDRIAEHARHFVAEMKELLAAQPVTDDSPIITSLYDTELFGHWWSEGPRWLKAVLRALALDPAINLTTCSAHLHNIAATERRENLVSLPEGSWGEGGFHWVWLNADTQWMWERIYDAERRMGELVAKYADNSDVARPLQQAARELLLLESSDWPFVTTTKGAPRLRRGTPQNPPPEFHLAG